MSNFTGEEVLAPGHNYATVTDHINDIVVKEKIRPGWVLGFLFAFSLLMALFFTVGLLLKYCVGIWGINIPVGWGFDIINFVWWIGIGHAGTLISAILLLFRQDWRTSINRFAEAMTLFAVACAAMFPILHMGRPEVGAYWVMPYPNVMSIWPQFRSPLMWDVFAISTYGLTSLLFWLVGLLPDFATLRDHSPHKWQRYLFGFCSLGWRGSAVHWSRFETIYLILAGLATPLVLSVHTIVSFDFAVGIVPGWHTTIFPPYFVAGAIYSGFAMVLTLMIPTRYFFKLEDFITIRHLNNMAKVMLLTGLIVAYGYFIEGFIGWYSGSEYEKYMLLNRFIGPYKWLYYALLACNVFIPQLLWFRSMRRNIAVLFVMSLIVNTGMWLERFVIIVVSLSADFLPANWGMYYPSVFDWTMYVGTIGLFFTLLFIFIRILPMISVFEMRVLVTEEEHKKKGAHHG